MNEIHAMNPYPPLTADQRDLIEEARRDPEFLKLLAQYVLKGVMLTEFAVWHEAFHWKVNKQLQAKPTLVAPMTKWLVVKTTSYETIVYDFDTYEEAQAFYIQETGDDASTYYDSIYLASVLKEWKP
jgi:hypothetical protein